ncbi:hypothetical protein GOP47_0018388 [Adiantum capillus-veneris]|nr:hypothetical protein GOP47_0018388 [Adiantum capillus-veneris]
MAGRSKAYCYMQRAVKCSSSFPTSRHNACPGHPTFTEAIILPLQNDSRIQGPQLPKVDGSIDVTCTTSSSLGFTVARGSLSQFAGAQLHGTISFEHAKLCRIALVRFYANVSTTNGKELDCSAEIRVLHETFMNHVQGKNSVPLALMRRILEECNSTGEVELAFQTLQKYRIHRSSKGRVKHNFNENISALAVSASLKSKTYELGLKALWKHNVYGLSPNIQTAHMFLSHARQERNMGLMKKTFETMLKNLIIPTTQTAEIMIRICKDNKDINFMFTLADEFLQNEVKLGSSVFDILIATAANFGDVEKVFKAQKWREDAGFDHTTASAFAIAKAHILQGEPQIGVDVIAKNCKDKVKVNKYLMMLVQSWPVQLLAKKEDVKQEGQDHMLKENVLLFANALSKQFRGVSINAEIEYGKGGEAKGGKQC